MGAPTKILDASGRPMADAQPVRAPRAGAYGGGYMRGGRSVALNAWAPSLREAQADVAAAWDQAAARSIDAIINSGWLSGAIDQCVANTVGTGFRLKVQPENNTFGMENKAAQSWSRMVEQRFELWAGNPAECDVQGKRTFGQLQAAAFRGWIGTGEILSELAWREREGQRYRTKVRLLPPYRLSRESDPTKRLVTGIYLDDDDRAVAYQTRRRNGLGMDQVARIEATGANGRRRIGHFHDGPLGAVRGIGPLVPVLQVIRQFDDLSDATLAAAVLRTLWAATIESDLPTAEVLEGLVTPQEMAELARDGVSPFEAFLEMSAGHYSGAQIDVGRNGRIGHLMPGDKLNLQTTVGPDGNYRDYAGDLKREMARTLGMTYESFTGDYNGATYNSMSYGTTEIFEVTKVRRASLVAPFCQFAYEAWLEEEVAFGGIEFPGGYDAFVANRQAASRALWRGAPKPLADMLKAAKAFETLDRMGVIPQAVIADAFGLDIEDVYDARQQERSMRGTYGLPEPAHMLAGGGAPQRAGDDEEE